MINIFFFRYKHINHESQLLIQQNIKPEIIKNIKFNKNFEKKNGFYFIKWLQKVNYLICNLNLLQGSNFLPHQ